MNSQPPKLLDQLRQRIRLRGYSIRTEKAYVSWAKRFILFNGRRKKKKEEEERKRKGTGELLFFKTGAIQKSDAD